MKTDKETWGQNMWHAARRSSVQGALACPDVRGVIRESELETPEWQRVFQPSCAGQTIICSPGLYPATQCPHGQIQIMPDDGYMANSESFYYQRAKHHAALAFIGVTAKLMLWLVI